MRDSITPPRIGPPPGRLPLYAGPGLVYDAVHLAISLGLEERIKKFWISRAVYDDAALILDWGTGTGLSALQALRLMSSGSKLMLVERQPGMMARAKERLRIPAAERGVGIVSGSCLEELNLKPASVDVIIASYSLGMLSDKDATLAVQAFYELLRPGGNLLVIDMRSSERSDSRLGRLFDRTNRLISHVVFGEQFSETLPNLIGQSFYPEAYKFYGWMQSFSYLARKQPD